MSKTVETNRDWQSHWTSVGQRTARDDLFRQVERTIGGQPQPQDQIELLIRAIAERLSLAPYDIVLDLCCGNGLITHRLAPLCRAVVGADYSLELIAVARERHAAQNIFYLHRAANDLKATDFTHGPPNKVCMNCSLQHFTAAQLERLLESLRGLTTGDLTLYFTDVPDAGKIGAFYNTSERWAEFERRRTAGTEAVGTWWDRNHLRSLMEAAGYRVTIADPEPERVTADYRFDVLAHDRRPGRG